MMIPTQNKLGAVSHPLVAAMYLKKDFGAPFSKHQEDVLVIETNFPVDEADTKSFNACLSDLLSDLPMLAVSTDRIDAELLTAPRRWDFPSLMRSMLGFGLVSSLFDGLTFLVLLQLFHASPATFQTAWFTESLLTELAVVAVMRTRKPFFLSLPSPLLVGTSVVVGVAAVALPYLPVAPLLGFAPLPGPIVLAIFAIVASYVVASELLKRRLAVLGPAAPGAVPGLPEPIAVHRLPRR